MKDRNFNIGTLLLQNGYPQEAQPYLEKCDTQDPDVALNLGACYRQQNRFREAGRLFSYAADKTDSPMAWTNIGTLYEDLGEFCEALLCHEKAHRMAPQHPQIALHYAMSLIRFGRLEEAWPLWELGRSPNDHAYPNLPRWESAPDGECYGNSWGKKILICREGGFGDAFLYLRWFKNLKDLGFHITFWVWDSVIPLLQGHPWIDCLLPASEGVHIFNEDNTLKYDFCLPLMSLPAALGITENLAVPDSYIECNPCEGPVKGRVGFCWAAEENTVIRKHRSLPDFDAQKLVHLERDHVWVSLVPSISLQGPSTYANIILKNWRDTAEIIKSCELVISVDTAVAHLAGALGVPTWILLPKRRDPKWGMPDKPFNWYPNVRYFNQTDVIKWDNVIEEVREALGA